MIRLVIFLLSFSLPVVVHAKGDLIASDSALPVHVITSEEFQKIPLENRSIDRILNSTPTKEESALRKKDIDLAKSNLRANVVLINGSRSHEDPSTIPAEMIDRIEVIKDGASAIYGSDAIGGVVNYITKKSFELHPQELPLSTAFKPIEIDWQSKNIALGRIGLRADRGEYAFGLSTFEKGAWSWTESMPVGATFGLNGPIVVLGKTSLGPGYSIYDQNGAFIGDLNKKRIQADPSVTGQYLLRAGYPELNTGLRSMDRIFTQEDFNPYGAFIFPKGQSMGDLFQIGDRFNDQLINLRGYDDSLHGLDGSCTSPYAAEQIFPRSVLDEIVPNDPLYQRSIVKKKGGIPLVGDLLSIGSGVLGVSVGTPVDKEGPAVYDQYSLPKIGFTNKFDPKSAWNLVDADSKNVVVAVIDSGLDLTHPDGPQYVWNNEHEIPGNNIDDDHNGYVDDVHGWNFLDENNDLKDLRGHGTVVAGIIAARSNNGIGIAGINPGAVIMPIKVADKFGNTNSLNIFRAIKYAVSNGAKIINISLGAKGVSALERLAINYARAKGVFVVIASGNDGTDISTFGPSSVPSALAVGAMNFDGTRSTVSNWGANNGLMAPGEEIYSLQSKDAPWEGPSGSKNRQYTKLSGTSFSAPMVAATASLLLVKDPSLDPFDLEDILEASAKKLGEEDWNGRTGAGLLDAANALASIGKKYLNVKITRLRKDYDAKGKKLEAVDVYATVRGDVDHFTVELAKGRNVKKFTTIIGFAGQQAHDDLVAHIRSEQLRGGDEWQVLVRALDLSGKEHRAIISLDLK